MSKKLFKNNSGETVLWQAPNLTIIGWAIFALLSYLTHAKWLGWISTTFLLVWAFLELFQGVNYFRRLLGLIVLIYILISLIGQLN